MSERAQALAARYRQANAEFVAELEGISTEQWRKQCPDESRTGGVVAHHIATIHPIIAGWVLQLVRGEAVEGVTLDLADQMNAHHAEEHAHTSKAETLEL